MTVNPKSNQEIVNDLKSWYAGILETRRTLPHDSYDSNCCDGENESLTHALIQKIKSILGDTS